MEIHIVRLYLQTIFKLFQRTVSLVLRSSPEFTMRGRSQVDVSRKSGGCEMIINSEYLTKKLKGAFRGLLQIKFAVAPFEWNKTIVSGTIRISMEARLVLESRISTRNSRRESACDDCGRFWLHSTNASRYGFHRNHFRLKVSG